MTAGNDEIEQFLLTLLNAETDTDKMAVVFNYGTILPDVKFPILQRVLRQAWIESHATKEWIVFLIRFTLKKNNALDIAKALESGTIPPQPPKTLFEEAVLYLLKHSDRARRCANSECSNSYFFVSRRNQRYCSDDCARPSQIAAKRSWWVEHGEEWRKRQDKQPKIDRKSSGKEAQK